MGLSALTPGLGTCRRWLGRLEGGRGWRCCACQKGPKLNPGFWARTNASALLQIASLGRVAVSAGAIPAVFPVRYHLPRRRHYLRDRRGHLRRRHEKRRRRLPGRPDPRAGALGLECARRRPGHRAARFATPGVGGRPAIVAVAVAAPRPLFRAPPPDDLRTTVLPGGWARVRRRVSRRWRHATGNAPGVDVVGVRAGRLGHTGRRGPRGKPRVPPASRPGLRVVPAPAGAVADES